MCILPLPHPTSTRAGSGIEYSPWRCAGPRRVFINYPLPNDFDPAPDLRRFRAPLLAIYGEADDVVPPADNVDLLRRLAREAGNDRARIVVVPRAGHGLVQAGELRTLAAGGEETTYWKFPRPAPDALEALVSFLAGHGMTGERPRQRPPR